jgi:solute carrier family 13 (sodium-dependent dicarboxylate transporter), member 2/3/5
LIITFTVGVVAVVATLVFDSAILRLTTIIAAMCLALWLSEAVPPFVPTIVLCTVTPLLLGPLDKKFALPSVLKWAMDPVLVLFFGGFVLSVAAQHHGFDKRLANFALRSAGGSFSKFLLLTILLTAFLSMWMSNIAAAVLMLACLHPVLRSFEIDDILRRALLVGVALGANLGGISTPIGTGPNAIAIAWISESSHISFFSWMSFALPLSAGMLLAGFAFIWFRARRGQDQWASKAGRLSEDVANPSRNAGESGFLAILAVTISLWLTEPFHGIAASIISLGSASVLFLTKLLNKEDLLRVDWSTLLLIAGGITLGKLLEQSGAVNVIAANVAWNELDPTMALFMLCFACAMLSAFMSNTATVVMLIPLAHALLPAPSTAILVAIAASFGIPFVISTPPNAMAFGRGGLRFGDLFWPGLLVMALGCLMISVTGKQVLGWVGIP